MSGHEHGKAGVAHSGDRWLGTTVDVATGRGRRLHGGLRCRRSAGKRGGHRRTRRLADVHDLHASSVATGLPVLSVHAVVDDECFHDGHLMWMLDELQECLAGHFDVQHSTIQFEAASHVAHEQGAHR